ncbi:MAG TPA: hypothetical protein DIS98_02490 [Colwellia sp.]|nr:hypothetical protein [Colwellia sp.]|tara:strand:- start:1103 stop:3193 length:2091 start_codon:yes stop_codon:yes gene_type:complete
MHKSTKIITKKILLFITITLSMNAYAQDNSTDKATPSKKEIETISVVNTEQSSIKISSSKLLTLPGTGGDPLKGLEALPGVILATSNSGGPVAEPAIRGSSSKDNLYLTDGLNMGYVFHNDGLSVYNPLLIESFELQAAAWSPQYTNANGGVILTTLRDPNGDNPQRVLDLSLFRSGFLYEQGITKNSAFYVSYRESLVHTYVDNFIEDEDFSFAVPPRNRDYQTKFIWELDYDNILRFSASGAKDYIEIAFDEDGRDIKKNPDLASGIRFATYYDSQAISWEYRGDIISGQSSVNLLQTSQQDREGEIFAWQADISQIIVKSDNQYFGENLTVNFGAHVSSTDVDYTNSGRLLPCNTEFEMCPPSYFSSTFAEVGSIKTNEYNIYTSIDSQLSESLSYQFGFSAIGSNRNDEFYLEPRANIRWQINQENSLRFAYGVHHKWVDDYRLLTQELGNQLLKASSSDHFLIGIDNKLINGWKLRTEIYYKDFDNLIVANPDAQITAPDQVIPNNTLTYLDVASGSSYGIELLINKQLSDKWFGWASIAYSKTERDNPLTKEVFNAEFDLPWVANLVLDYKFSEQWQAGLKWRLQSGRRYTDVVSASPYYEGDDQEPLFYVPQYGVFNGEQVKMYHRLDLRVDYQTELMGLNTRIYFEVLNLYSSKTIQEFEYNKDYSSYEKDYQFPDMPLPSVGITLNF